MFKKGDHVRLKTIEELIDTGLVDSVSDISIIYVGSLTNCSKELYREYADRELIIDDHINQETYDYSRLVNVKFADSSDESDYAFYIFELCDYNEEYDDMDFEIADFDMVL